MAHLRRPLFLAVATLSVSLSAHAEGQLRLSDAIRLALGRNERAQIAPLRVEDAEGSLERARAGFLPSLTFGAQGTKKLVEDRTKRTFTSAGTLTFTQPLFNPSAIPTHAQADHTLQAEKHSAYEDRRVLAFDTARAFANALAAEQVLVAGQQRALRAKANLDNAQARADAALNSTNDATKARVELTAAAREVATGKGTLRRAQISLGLLIGDEVAGALETPDALIDSANRFSSDGRAVAKRALETRADLRAIREQVKAAHWFAKEPHYRMAPVVSFTAQFRGDPNPLPTDRWHDESLILSLTWPLFDGGARYGDRKSRVARAESLELQERLARRTVATAADLALASLSAAKEALAAAEEAVEVAKKNSEETEILYKQGLAKAIELTDANARRFDAEVGLAQAKLSLAQAYLDVRFAMGLWPLDDDGQGNGTLGGGK